LVDLGENEATPINFRGEDHIVRPL